MKQTFINVHCNYGPVGYKLHCVSKKRTTLSLSNNLRQILTDFQNYFTGTFCIQFGITRLPK